MSKSEFDKKFRPYIKRFTNPAQAVEYAEKSKSPKRILLGDHPEYWVVPPTIANRLNQLGYEFYEQKQL